MYIFIIPILLVFIGLILFLYPLSYDNDFWRYWKIYFGTFILFLILAVVFAIIMALTII